MKSPDTNHPTPLRTGIFTFEVAGNNRRTGLIEIVKVEVKSVPWEAKAKARKRMIRRMKNPRIINEITLR